MSLCLERFYKRLAISHGLISFFAVVEVVSKRGVYLAQCQIVFGGDFIGALSHSLMPNHDVLHTDPATGNSGLATQGARRAFNVLVNRHTRMHQNALILSRA